MVITHIIIMCDIQFYRGKFLITFSRKYLLFFRRPTTFSFVYFKYVILIEHLLKNIFTLCVAPHVLNFILMLAIIILIFKAGQVN